MLVVARAGDHKIAGHDRQKLALAGAQHLGHAVRVAQAHGVALAQRAHGGAELLVDAGERQQLDRLAMRQQVHRAPVGQVGHRHLHHLRDRGAVVVGGRKRHAGLGQQVGAAARAVGRQPRGLLHR